MFVMTVFYTLFVLIRQPVSRKMPRIFYSLSEVLMFVVFCLSQLGACSTVATPLESCISLTCVTWCVSAPITSQMKIDTEILQLLCFVVFNVTICYLIIACVCEAHWTLLLVHTNILSFLPEYFLPFKTLHAIAYRCLFGSTLQTTQRKSGRILSLIFIRDFYIWIFRVRYKLSCICSYVTTDTISPGTISKYLRLFD